MKHALRSLLSVALAFTLLGVPAPSLACCDGFWSCAAAVATLGLSCAAEALLNAVKQMKQDVEDLRTRIDADLKLVSDATKGSVRDAGDGLKQAAADARSKLDQAVVEGAKLEKQAEARGMTTVHFVNPAGAGALAPAGGGSVALASTPTPSSVAFRPPPAGFTGGGSKSAGGNERFDPPCDDATALANVKRAAAELQKQQKIQETEAQRVHELADAARAQAELAAGEAKIAAASVLVAPLVDLAGMLDDLIHHPEHLFNPGAVIEAGVRKVTEAIGSQFDKMTAAIVAEANKSLEQSRQHAQAAEKQAAAAANVAKAMGNVLRAQSKSNCDRLASLLPPSGVSLASHLVSFEPGALQATARTAPEALLRTRPGTHKPGKLTLDASAKLTASSRAFLSKQQVVFKPTPVPGADASFRSYMDAQFRGLTKAQGPAKKNELLAEARRRYANDAKVQRQVVDLITRESDARIRALR